ncbi:MAG: site-specific DNA-methyltransferase [Anaerolineales bacterium]|nr:site-specific DNA-methyltransferase [Anaerolineales bacterium]
MTNRKQKLELTWIGKEERPRLEPRILLEEPERSYHAAHRVGENDLFDNRLIFGDNLLALKALEQEFTGKIKCIFIDPPYNTGSAFAQYDDGIEHSLWLSLMRDRIDLMRRLLNEDGSLWITIDDNEAHYLKVLCDEIFGRSNFVANAIWEKKYSPQNDAKWLSDSHDHILVYAKDKHIWRPNLLPRTHEMDRRYKNPDNDPRGSWKPADFSVKTYSITYDYPITLPSGRVVSPPKSRCWVTSKERFEELVSDNRIWFGKTGNNVPSLKKFLTEVKQGSVSKTLWARNEVGDNQEAKKEVKVFNSRDVFETPKPERLLERILTLGSNSGDWVLDSFAGSGTTGAVAHKMGRRWIMVELGEHCHTHIIPRLQKVIDGQDPGGISKGVGWQGGGGFRYFRLAPSLLAKDRWGNWVINKQYNPAMLAEAVCKLEGFTYAPSDAHFWCHGHSTEQDFIYVTTQTLSHEQLLLLNDEVGPQRSLLVMCAAYRAAAADYPNLTIKKIPQAVLQRCEYGKDDYSLQVENLPQAAPSTGRSSTFGKSRTSEGGGDGEENVQLPEEVEGLEPTVKQMRLDFGAGESSEGKSSTSGRS